MMILWTVTSLSKVCEKGDLRVIVYLYFTSVFCWRSCFYGGVARVWCGVGVSAGVCWRRERWYRGLGRGVWGILGMKNVRERLFLHGYMLVLGKG